jgi:hypothetical protein
MMELADFRADLLNRVETRAAVEQTFTREAFMGEVGERLSEAEEVEQLDVLDFEGKGRSNRNLAVHGFDLNDSDESIALAVLSFDGGAETSTIDTSEVTKRFRALQYFVEESVSGEFQEEREESTSEFQLAEDLRHRGRAVSRYRLYLVTDKQLGTGVRTLESTTVNGVQADFHLWDVARFKQVAESRTGRDPLVIDLTRWGVAGLPALEVVDSASDLKTYLAAVPGDMLADLYEAHGSRLLEGNVRSYLSNRSKVNKGIRTTVASTPANFLAYNNGITATATAVEKTAGGLSAITDLQIVNGGQTTASLFYVKRENKGQPLDDVFVQMKLVVVEPEVAAEMIPKVSRFANSQNRVSEADFFSNSPFHIRLEELSRRVLVPPQPGVPFQTKWFYERTRGSYQNEKSKRSVSQQKKFEAEYPRAQVIDKTAAAKYEVTWGMQPHKVSAGAQKNFVAFADMVARKWETSDLAFNELYWKQLVAKGILFETVRKAVAKADWYEKGYLANYVTYTLAKLAHEVGKQSRGGVFDFDSIWEKQDVAPAVVDECLIIGEKVQQVLLSDARPVQNVTEWAKREQCWELVKAFHHALNPAITTSLADRSRVVEKRREAAATMKIDKGIDVQMMVVTKQASEWVALEEFARSKRLLTEKDVGILALVTGRKVGFPTEAQCKALVVLLERAKAMGFDEY